ncbi:MAG: hypothetical protein HY366_00910 [Candidatus Aenigmarchaeota archaeon]|nr:hypothetical protein [Candidatus Aenigmarchaeota archaeon]
MDNKGAEQMVWLLGAFVIALVILVIIILLTQGTQNTANQGLAGIGELVRQTLNPPATGG